MKPTFLKGAVVGGIAGAVMAAGTVAVASTSNFILGSTTANTPNALTAVTAQNVDGTGGLNGKMIQLTNNSTGASATALGLTVGSGRPPFTVNSATKVTNLNADQLDGLDSSALQRRVTGSCASGSAIRSIGFFGTGVTCQTVGTTVLWAVVDAAGALARSTGTTGSIHLGPGTYQVNFNRDVSGCAYTATIGPIGAGSSSGDIDVATRAGNNNAVFIETRDNSGVVSDRPFHLMVAC
jgi:hypothetical protein